MRTRLAPKRLDRPAALACAVLLVALGSRDVFFTGDFMVEAWLAYEPLRAGDLAGFLDRLPGYAGFVALVGAPAALLADALGWHETATLRLTAVPGALALAALAVHLARQGARSPGGRLLTIALAAGSPVAYQAILYGHPEDLLAAAGAVSGVLLARAGRIGPAALVLVAAVAAKQWAVLAIAPAVLAAPARGVRLGLVAGAGTLAVLAALQLLQPEAARLTATTGLLFHPHQLFWPLGVPATADFAAAGGLTERMAPPWLPSLSHPLIVALSGPLALAWWWRGGRGARNRDDALALLALLFLERCLLDPWNVVYYHLPLVLALLAWEVRRGREQPVLALGVTAAVWLSFVSYDEIGTPAFLAYVAWAVPLAALLVARLYGPAGARGLARAAVSPA